MIGFEKFSATNLQAYILLNWQSDRLISGFKLFFGKENSSLLNNYF